MAAILMSKFNVKPDVTPEVNHNRIRSHNQRCISVFVSMLYLKRCLRYDDLKIWPIYRPDDVISDVINTKNNSSLPRSTYHMWTKFGDDLTICSRDMVRQRHKQTNIHTNKQTDQHTCQNVILASNKTRLEKSIYAICNILLHDGNTTYIFYGCYSILTPIVIIAPKGSLYDTLNMVGELWWHITQVKTRGNPGLKIRQH